MKAGAARGLRQPAAAVLRRSLLRRQRCRQYGESRSAPPGSRLPAPQRQRAAAVHRLRRQFRCLILFLVSGLPCPAGDVLTLKNGRTADCRVLSLSPTAVKILWQEKEERDIPAADIEFIEFAPLPGEEAALAKAAGEGVSEPLMEFWVKKIARLGVPRSNAGEVGLTYAELLSRRATPDRLARALTVYQQIESSDWSAERRGRARAGRLRLMLRQGRVEEVKPEAQKLLKESEDPRVLIEVQHVLAEAAASKLRSLLKEHPRWEQEDDIRPQRDRLFHEAIDAYLFPHAFHGAEEDLAARGLWAAAQFFKENSDSESARNAATDLVQLYPAAPEKSAAAKLLEELPAAKTEKPAPPEPDIPADAKP